MVLWASPLPAESPKDFASLLKEKTEITFNEVSAYIEQYPNAIDVESAYKWAFETAREQAFEPRALSLANRYLERPEGQRIWADLASEVRLMGLAKTAQWEEALAEWKLQLAKSRLAIPRENWDTAYLGVDLALEAQLAGKLEFAREIYEKMSRRFHINSGIMALCDTRLARLKLIGEKAPRISAYDGDDRFVDLGDYIGKWVLVDFWATTSRPWLASLPQLEQLNRTYHSRGLEIIGISVDEDADRVRKFQAVRQLPWRLAFSNSDEGRTLERYHALKASKFSLINPRGTPGRYLINPEGLVVLVDPRPADLSEFLKPRLTPAEKTN